MKPVDVNPSMYIDFNKENNKVGAKIKVKDIFKKCYILNWSEEDFMIEKKLKTLSRGQKTNKKEFRVQKLIERKSHKLYIRWNGYHNFFNRWIDKKDILCMIEYFPEPKSSRERVKVQLHLSNYVTKADLKNATDVHPSIFAKKIDLASLKFNLDKLDVYKLDVFVDLSKLNDVVKYDVVEKAVYNTKIKNIERKIPDITNLVTNTTLNAKINQAKNKQPNITNLATTTALTAVENKIPNVSNLVRKI